MLPVQSISEPKGGEKLIHHVRSRQCCHGAISCQRVVLHPLSVLPKKFESDSVSGFCSGIPQLAIITKVDKACPPVDNSIEDLYKSKHLKETKVYFIHVFLLLYLKGSNFVAPLTCHLMFKIYIGILG